MLTSVLDQFPSFPMFDVYIRYRVSLYNLNRSESGEGETHDSINARTNQTRRIDGFHIFHRERETLFLAKLTLIY